MIKRLQPATVRPTPSLWRRSLAFACVLLVLVAGAAQAVHMHGQWLPHQDTRLAALPDASQLLGGADRCSLCMAMHSALPVASGFEALPLIVLEHDLRSGAGRIPEPRWPFASFSRPPPALLS